MITTPCASCGAPCDEYGNPVLNMVSLNWSEEKEPNEECRYNHVTADTPFGRFLITWKGWKKYDSPTIDETPWGYWFEVAVNVQHAKELAELEYIKRINEALTGE